MNYSIVPAHLAVKAMRDNGYKNAAHALAELMDNSIQAGASMVELLCGERRVQLEANVVKRVSTIAILDNGSGMDADILRIALQFGNGTHLSAESQTGIGRFGMGLPSASISQCKRVEVWSWQEGPDRALRTYLDLDEIVAGKMSVVPEPTPAPVPAIWRKVGASFGKSGTLVVWSDLDRLIWKTAETIISNSEFLIGRMYRRFMQTGAVKIRMLGFDPDNHDLTTDERWALPNDPSYLMAGTSVPEPFGGRPMFKPWEGDANTIEHKIRFRGQVHPVYLRFSIATDEARAKAGGQAAGSRPHGKHAARNVGVSIVRADRELELDSSWATPSDPRERWWGVEVDFLPALDELFGVTNNKQHAHNFSEAAKIDFEELLKGGRSVQEVKEQMIREEDPRGPLLEIAYRIDRTLKSMRAWLRDQGASEERAGRRSRHKVDETAERQATSVTQQRQSEGYSGVSDTQETEPPEQRKAEIKETLVQSGLGDKLAEGLAAYTVDNGLKYVFAEASLETAAFFSVKPKGGSIVITLNTDHPAYGNLVEVLEKQNGDDPAALQGRLENAAQGLKLLLMAWARYEDEQPDGPRRANTQDARNDWGRIARQFLQPQD